MSIKGLKGHHLILAGLATSKMLRIGPKTWTSVWMEKRYDRSNFRVGPSTIDMAAGRVKYMKVVVGSKRVLPRMELSECREHHFF